MWLASISLLIISNAFGQPMSYWYDKLNETEKLWHRDLIYLTLGMEQAASASYSCARSVFLCCSCASQCYSTGSCCVDAYFPLSPLPVEKYLKFISRKVYERSLATCLPVLVGLPNSHNVQKIMQVASCPVDIATGSRNLTLQKLCETEVPNYIGNGTFKPTLVAKDNIIYRNQHCAECNGVFDFDRVNITADDCNLMSAENSQENVTFEDLFDCNFEITIRATDCSESPQSHRPISISEWSAYSRNCSRKDYGLCFLYNSPVYASLNGLGIDLRSVFANKYCLLCMRNETKRITQPCFQPNIVGKSTPWQPGYSVLITFDDYDVVTDIKRPCKEGEVYNSISRSCFAKMCMKPYQVTSRECGMPFKIDLSHLSSDDTSDARDSKKYFLRCVLYSSGSSLYATSALEPLRLLRSISPELASDILDNMNLGDFPSNLTEYFVHRLNLTRSFEKLIISSVEAVKNSLYMNSLDHSLPHHRLCSNIVELTDNYLLPSNCRIKVSSIITAPEDVAHSAEVLTLLDRISLRIELEGDNYTYKVFYCKELHLHSNCELSVYSEDAFLMLPNRSALIRSPVNASLVLRPDQYVPLANGIGSCVLETLDTLEHDEAWRETLSKATKMITTFGSVLSLISLPLTIAIVLTYKVLCTVPGKHLISLSISIFMSDSLILTWMYVDLSTELCHSIAILLHFALLAQHFCCLIFVVSLVRTLSSKMIAKRLHKERSRAHIIAAWGTSALLVFACLMLDRYNLIQYGHGGFCWIYSRKGRIYGYILPAFMILSVNIVLFITALVQIRNAKMDSHLASQASTDSDNFGVLSVGLRLCFLLGFLEIFGVIQKDGSSIDSELFNASFNTVYSVTRSLRGFLLFLSFTARKRVLRLVLASATKRIASNKKPNVSNDRDGSTSMTTIQSA